MGPTTVGEIQLIAKIDTSQYKQGATEIEQANRNIEASADNVEKKSNASFNRVAKVGLAAITTAAVSAGAAIIKNIGNAVSRVDTLNNFPRVMQNLGYGADEAEKAIKQLDEGVRGLPTSLDSIASAMQNIAPATGNLESATQLTVSLNNALLAGGKSASDQAIAMEQFSQAIARGKPDLQEWRTLATTMPGQMKQLSNSLGYDQWQQMAQAVTDGELSFNSVLDSIVKLNEDGLGELPSFAEQARNATDGIGTSFANMNTAITRGLGGILDAIGRENISNALNSIGNAFTAIFSLITMGIGFIKSNADIFMPIINGIGAFIAAFGGLITAVYLGVKAFAALRAAMTLLTAHPIILTLSIIAGLIAAIATSAGMKNLTEGLDDSADSAEKAGAGVGNIANNLKQAGSGAKSLGKELAKIDKQIDKTNRDFREQLAELVSNKRQSIAELTSQLAEEDEKYRKAYSDRLYNFNKTQQEESARHQEKTRALQTQIDFLSRYNNQANQRRLSELRFALTRENAEFDKRNTERQEKYDQDAEHERVSYEKRRDELQTRLNNETALLDKHRADVDSIRNVMLLDEIEKLKRSRNEQLANLAQQRNDAVANAASTANAVAGQWSSPSVKNSFGKAGQQVGNEMGKAMVNAVIEELKKLPGRVWEASKPGGAIDRMFNSMFGGAAVRKYSPLGMIISSLGFATGGFTGRGGVNEPAGVVHKGEYVLPQNLVNQSTGLPDLDKLIGSMNTDTKPSQPVVVNLSHSRGALRQAALDTIELVNEVYRSKGLPQIGVTG